MKKNYKYLIKNTGILAVSSFSSKLLIFFLVPIYTSILSTSEYGIYDLTLSTISLLYPIFTINIIDGVMRFSIDGNANHKKIISISLKFIFLGISIIGVLLFLNHSFYIWMDIYGLELYIFFYSTFSILNQLLIQFSKGLEKIKDMGISGIIGTIITIIFNILFLLVWNLGLKGLFIANILGQLVPFLYLAIRLRIWHYIDFIIDKQLQKKMILYSAPLMLSVIGWWVNSAADKYIVTFFCGIDANGILSIAYKIPAILSTLQGIFIQAWQISAIKEYNSEESNKFYRDSFMYLNALMCVGCSGLIWMLRPIAHILFANDFYQAWTYVPFLMVSTVINASSGYIGPILAAKNDSKTMALSAFWGTSINIILNFILIYFIGIQGATIATVIASYVIYRIRKKAIKNIISYPEYRFIIYSWSLLFAQALCEILLQSHLLTGLLFIIILCIYRKNLLTILRSLKI